jgi:hypothetical protein
MSPFLLHLSLLTMLVLVLVLPPPQLLRLEPIKIHSHVSCALSIQPSHLAQLSAKGVDGDVDVTPVSLEPQDLSHHISCTTHTHTHTPTPTYTTYANIHVSS